MGLENTLETLDGMSDRRKALYTEKDGKFELDEDYRTEDINPLKNALQRQKDANTAAKEKEAELQAIIDDNAMKLAEAAGDKKEVERLKQAALDKQKSAHDAELSESKQLIHDLTIGSARDSIAREIYIDSETLKTPLLDSSVKLEDDGRSVFYVNSLGEKITRAELVILLNADERMTGHLKAGKGSGGGSNGGDAPTGKTPDAKLAEQNAKIQQRIKNRANSARH